MGQPSDASPQLALPTGGGALTGIGEKFTPDLFTGTGNFTVPITLPPGRNGLQPDLRLSYSTGNGNGIFGLGWMLDIPGITRKTSHGLPHYDEPAALLADGERRDVFILSGAEDLVAVDDSNPRIVKYRPRTEGLFANIERHRDAAHDFWKVESKSGLVSLFGGPVAAASTPAVTRHPDRASVFSWSLTETKDPFGNLIRYRYDADAGARDGHRWNQPLLRSIRYADYGAPADDTFLVHVGFVYDAAERPDPFSDYRAGFEIRTAKRCIAIRVSTRTSDGTVRPMREYRFDYASAANGASLLQRMDVVGFDDAGRACDDDNPASALYRQLPPLTFAYTRFDPTAQAFGEVTGTALPARTLGASDLALVDLHGGGVPDLLEMNGAVRYWRNLGGGRFDLPRPMTDAPAHALGDPGVQLIDANGDGRTDLLVTNGAIAGYYPLTHRAAWARESFQRHETAPSVRFDDAEVRLIDLDGDGCTDVVRSGTRMECFFNDRDPRRAWTRSRAVSRQSLDVFPDVNFSDPRVKIADLNGDGLDDIALIHDGNVEYWPNHGHGNWGPRLSMRRSPRLPYGYDPRRILLGDVDGDGAADLVYVDGDRVLLWLNHSGNGWSEEPLVIRGTPPVTTGDDVRLIDLNGTGVSGVLWSSDAIGRGRSRMMFLDFTGGRKPHVLSAMDNHMGAITRVEYRSSTEYYLADERTPATRWRTPLPFPVQVVARVEVIDAVSRAKLTTEYRYHHGYWDGVEREFRGFGLVEQLDTETFADYHSAGLHAGSAFAAVPERNFSPPTRTRNWYHQGPVGDEAGDHAERDYSTEYWHGDAQLLGHEANVDAFLRNYNDRGARLPSQQARRIKRDALRALRGSLLRSEVYGLDADGRQIDGERIDHRPYAVTEQVYGLREIDPPPAGGDRPRVFFAAASGERRTRWERGVDPMTQFVFQGDFDAFGQPRQQTTIAVPRLARHQRSVTGAVVGVVTPDETRILATHTRTTYAVAPPGMHIHDRIAQVKLYELIAAPPGPDQRLDTVPAAMRKQFTATAPVLARFAALAAGDVRVIGHQVNHYDGADFEGLAAGRLGARGALMRTEALAVTPALLDAGYAGRRPDYLDGPAPRLNTPAGFGGAIGYRKEAAVSGGYEAGYYIDTLRQRLSARGLPVAVQDALKHESRIHYDPHDLLAVRIVDAVGLESTAAYNYRLLLAQQLIEPNGSSTNQVYNAIGLPSAQFIVGHDPGGVAKFGGTAAAPEIAFTYDFRNFERTGAPVFVHTSRRVHHSRDGISNDAIEAREYSDGYGRVIQSRAQADDDLFGVRGDDVGLPSAPGSATTAATAVPAADRVCVSAWKIVNNKGLPVHVYEPFFSRGWGFEAEALAKQGQHTTSYYDPAGRVVRTRRPDGSEERVVFGTPLDPIRLQITAADSDALPAAFNPSPWERYIFDANDLAAAPAGSAAASHRFTPASVVFNALGRAICAIARNGALPASDWAVTRTEFDSAGNATVVTDALGRRAFTSTYDLRNLVIAVDSIDAGLRTTVFDARGLDIETADSNGNLTRRVYDTLGRPVEMWARETSGGAVTLRERIAYGDAGNRADAKQRFALGKRVAHHDEAGVMEIPAYDFKGNITEKRRRTIRDDRVAAGWVADWSAANATAAIEATSYHTSIRYDALNRPVALTYPQDASGARKTLRPDYNRAGALASMRLDADVFVERIAYNAKGQRVLIAYGNGVMSRYTYDSQTFLLSRLRTEPFSHSGGVRAFQPAGAVLQDFSYGYDPGGNITQIDDRTPGGGVRNSTHGVDRLLRVFTYDPLYRLLSATGRACKDIGSPRGIDDAIRCGAHTGSASASPQNAANLTETYTETFEYDPAGNILQWHFQAVSGQWTRRFGMGGVVHALWATAVNNRTTSFETGSGLAPRACAYDANGNMIGQDADRHHDWNHHDRMVRYRVQAGAGAPPSLEARYLYGADGLRIKKWVRRQNGDVATTIYVDGVFEQHQLKTAAATSSNSVLHIMDDTSRVAMVRVGPALDARDVGPAVQYHLGDHLGSSHIVLGGSDARAGALISREEYFAYGETSFGSFARKRYRFNGKEKDDESGLYNYGARYMAPWLGRWISCDPAGPVDSLNVFRYCRLSPLMFVDPRGTTPNLLNRLEALERRIEESEKRSANLPAAVVDAEGNGIEINSSELRRDFPELTDALQLDNTVEVKGAQTAMQTEDELLIKLRTMADETEFEIRTYHEDTAFELDRRRKEKRIAAGLPPDEPKKGRGGGGGNGGGGTPPAPPPPKNPKGDGAIKKAITRIGGIFGGIGKKAAGPLKLVQLTMATADAKAQLEEHGAVKGTIFVVADYLPYVGAAKGIGEGVVDVIDLGWDIYDYNVYGTDL